MDETGVILSAVAMTATTVGAFWLRTEAIRDEIKKWVDDKYMTREATNLRFDAIQAMFLTQGRQMQELGAKVERMERRQGVQIEYLRSINNAIGTNRRIQEPNEGNENNEHP